MGEGLLLGQFELGHRPIESVGLKDRIVPEALLTAWRYQDFSWADAFRDLTRTVGQCNRGSAEETCAPGWGESFELRQQRFESTSVVEANSAVSGRVGSRRPPERVDLEPRIVRNTRDARRPRSSPRLRARVLEVVSALLGKIDGRKLRQGEHFEINQDAADLAIFPGVCGRNDEASLLGALRAQRIS